VSLAWLDFFDDHYLGRCLHHLATESLCASVTDVLGFVLVPDKARLGFRFPCDGPGRGGTWDVQRRICGGLPLQLEVSILLLGGS